MRHSCYHRGVLPDAVLAAARVFVALPFMLHAFVKMAHFSGSAQLLAAKGIPAAALWTALSTALEALGSGLLILGLGTRGAALALVAVCAPATILFNLGAPDHQVLLFKDFAIIGALLQFAVHGPGAFSFDRKHER